MDNKKGKVAPVKVRIVGACFMVATIAGFTLANYTNQGAILSAGWVAPIMGVSMFCFICTLALVFDDGISVNGR
jgi:hypothetical protein